MLSAMWTFLGGSPTGSVRGYVTLVLVTLLITSLGTTYYMYNDALETAAEHGTEVAELNAEIEKQKLDIVELNTRVAERDTAISKLEAQQKVDQTEVLRLAQFSGNVQSELSRVRKQYEDYKRRTNVVQAKPELVARLANRATSRMFRQIECSTGNTDSCDSDVPPAAPTTNREP